ncbi:dihydrofolate reductase family protein [Deinococcus sedimenti]|uniref:Deaminase reductase n=1 Tax=Deinococcus sedimenti TaxID=1867090 RepID=A0ABQ2S7E5_9DEIO|nr:dihydrofolate reductase family protein [Deinococcus sedimenti]GGR96524.1 deaminase reductase [Deinococcus sedimenti]
MSRVFLDLALSLDGFMAAPGGADGGLHDWYFAPDAAEDIKAELLSRIGAIILGRAAFGTAPDGFDTEYHVPHFILTHTPRPSVHRGGASFHFVTGGVHDALTQACAAAGDRDVCVAGGADVARQFLAADLLDEMQLHVAPVLLGGGLRLFTDAPPTRLKHLRTVQSAHATHVTYRLRTPPQA